MTFHPRQIKIADYDFSLPDEAIASYPLPNRELSKLLIYSQGEINDTAFSHVPDILQSGDVIISNDTRVIPARLMFKKATGGQIEILCLEPLGMSHQDAMSSTRPLAWKCMIGGARKWKNNEVLYLELSIHGHDVRFFAKKGPQDGNAFQVEFSWDNPNFNFSEMLHQAGQIPLPPYFNRAAESDDTIRYQTVFARHEGSVAAPTAGLHFTPEILHALEQNGISNYKLTLHVGAGTFKPVSSETIDGHEMHGELFSIPVHLLEFLASDHEKRIVAVGTTTVRTLESLFWLGTKMLKGEIDSAATLSLGQWEAYEMSPEYSLKEALNALIRWCHKHSLEHFSASTSIMIVPGFQFRICKAMFTNFHLPKSTLLLLVSAFIGDDWKRLYQHALQNKYRFLSYGDSSLLNRI